MFTLNRFASKQIVRFASGAGAIVQSDGDNTYNVRLTGCTWAEILAIGQALVPEDVGDWDALREGDNVEAKVEQV